jgi:hypothetical protein
MHSRNTCIAAICAIVACSTTAADVLGQTPAVDRPLPRDSERLSPILSEATADLPPGDGCGLAGSSALCHRPQWTASADFIIFDRVGSVNRTIVETVPGTVPLKDLEKTTGTEVLNANDLRQGFAGGPRLDLIHHGENEVNLEFLYFQIDGWNDEQSRGPTPDDWLVMRAPGGFLQTQDNKQKQMMVWDYASRLYNAELNVRWNPFGRVTAVAGFRWVNLSEDLQGTLPPERSVPFWDNQTKNNLYGFQIGADATLFERGRLSIGGVLKTGVFNNHVDETTAVSIYRVLFLESASTNHCAFLGETGVQAKYQVTERLAFKAGYEAIWLQGVALAPAQIADTYSHITPPVSVQAIGVNCGSGVFYHGATVGLEYAF